ncbi:16S rRNA (guanine(966)-N(2))-methyltransferase RsmD [Thiocapsa bogorovii]|uniref:16S rRNA (guanine(966)-N(2))-methyltransferase RsmD n=1 Tax=Thiocapsa bogorovii TaxID=521689 RepID=UPI001E4DE9F7|nr:16S rRNA (guanine(966)-N(2))-methyltransferase RsmD [Thiocapsa bogorovii]UHD18763.1 16S rRNA (guanine(966)-N(2))-methyltransferase RsmD [Thiocapsa bogorovii]
MARARGELRIVGGRYRGRRLPIPNESGLRPTSDRVRETLFNWLAPVIPGARCLDAFAGSGALGFEAVSRGAGEVILIEQSGAVVRQLQTNARRLGAEETRILHGNAIRWLEGSGQAFDIVFLDPPFADALWAPAIERLAHRGWLKAGSRVYLEAPARSGFPDLPAGWDLVRDNTAGQVRYVLVIVGSDAETA